MVTRANAPLLYALVVMRFPKVINVDRLAGAFQEQIQAEYPLESDYASQGIEVIIGPNGPEIKPTVEKFWQFSDLAKGHALILGSEFLVLHAGTASGGKPAYCGHIDFISRFVKATEAFKRAAGMNTVMSALGYRYIDLVVPRSGNDEGLSNYLEPWVMPSSPLALAEGVTLVDSVYVAGFRTPVGILRFQALRNPNATLPPELDSRFVRENGWVADRPPSDFALLDIDHAATFTSPLAIEPAIVEQNLLALQDPAAALFKKTMTPHAEKIWSENP